MYKDIKTIYDREQLIFNMAVTHLFDIGFRAASKITDEDIDNLEGNWLMTRDFVQDLVKVTREIAQTCSPVELIQFCQIEQIFDTRWFKEGDE